MNRIFLTYRADIAVTTVDDPSDVRGPVDCPERDGIMGLCRAGWLYGLTGRDVTIRVVRPRVAELDLVVSR